MRKRKRGPEYGSYIDEDTGEVTTVQTSKQAKRAYQKSGKWYKEPTEAELRAWDREEKRQALADRAAKKEENKKANAAKRAEKERKEELLKRQMFQAGKITFTQTLAKKDEDQQNLHSWFGGRPSLSKLKAAALEKVDGTGDRNKEIKGGDNQIGAVDSIHDYGTAADGETCSKQAKKLSQGESDQFADDIDDTINLEDIFDEAIISPNNHNSHQAVEPDQRTSSDTMDQIVDQLMKDDIVLDQLMDQENIPDFEILEDETAGVAIPDHDTDQAITNPFKVPALPYNAQSPVRLPLSPMSPSDVNIRNAQTSSQVSSFKSRLEKAKIEITPSTQAVRDILWGISTQDLADDVEDIDKENDDPNVDNATSNISPVKSVKHSSPLRNVSLASNIDSAPADMNKSFDSNLDQTDYDSIFFELDAVEKAGQNDNFNDSFLDESGLDDATLLSLPPATQLVSSTRNSTPAAPAGPVASDQRPAKSTRQPFAKSDSFALAFEELDDIDLLASLSECEPTSIEAAQKPFAATTTLPVRASLATSTSSASLKKKRVLPWERSSWDANVNSGRGSEAAHDGDADADGDTEMATQDTQILSSFG